MVMLSFLGSQLFTVAAATLAWEARAAPFLASEEARVPHGYTAYKRLPLSEPVQGEWPCNTVETRERFYVEPQ